MPETDKFDPAELLDRISFGVTKDGKVVELRMARRNGKVAHILCEYGGLAGVVQHIEQAAAQAYDIQKANLGGFDPHAFGPVAASAVAKMRGGYSQDGKPIIDFVLESGMHVALSVPEDDIPELVSWLQGFDEARQKGKPGLQ